ncbi:unknown similar to AMEV156 [Choristoneura biennis entomopoxvirus]|uniref:Uncharacterized protein n=1 Tax=Choristoneura biennis entomopoxvirus TaxID=10288 RepID=A0A916NXW2_CBEPV|nr:unknown similar to AMEV156 [Choristoneura biennis entomopoxvirus]CCU55767.1 unknown similar to AMEV156 [Choristoneura biennis entomopoxvirus]
MDQTYIKRMNKNINISNIDGCINALHIKYNNDVLISKMLSEIQYIIFEFATSDIITKEMINKFKHTMKLFYKMNNIKYFNEDYIILYTYLSLYSNVIYNMKDGDKNILKDKVFEIPDVIHNIYINKYINLNIENIILEAIRKNFNNNIDVQSIINLLRTDEDFNINIRNYIFDIIGNNDNIITQITSKIPIDNIINNEEFNNKLRQYIRNYISDESIVDYISNNTSFLNKIRDYINQNISINIIINKLTSNKEFLDFLNSYNQNYSNSNEFKNTIKRELLKTDNIDEILKNLLKNKELLNSFLSDDRFKKTINEIITNTTKSDDFNNIIKDQLLNPENVDNIINYINNNNGFIENIKQKILNDDYIINFILKNKQFLSIINDIRNKQENINIDSIIDNLELNDKFKNSIKQIINQELSIGNNINDIISNLKKDIKTNADNIIDLVNDYTNLEIKLNDMSDLEPRINELEIQNLSYQDFRSNMEKINEAIELTSSDFMENINYKNAIIEKSVKNITDNENTINNMYDTFTESINRKEDIFSEYISTIQENINDYKTRFLGTISNTIDNLNIDSIIKLLNVHDIDLSEDVKEFINKILPDLIKNHLNLRSDIFKNIVNESVIENINADYLFNLIQSKLPNEKDIIKNYLSNEYLKSDVFKNIVKESILENINSDYIFNLIQSKIPNEKDIIKKLDNIIQSLVDKRFYDINEDISNMNKNIKTNNTKISEISKEIIELKKNSVEKNENTYLQDLNDEKAKINKILHYLQIDSNLQTKYSNIKEFIKNYTGQASLQIKQIIINILNKLLSDSNIDISDINNIDKLEEKIIKAVNLLKSEQLIEFTNLLSETTTNLTTTFDEKIKSITDIIQPLNDNGETIGGIYKELNEISDKYNEILSKINNKNYDSLQDKIENILNIINDDFNNIIEIIKHNLTDLNNFIYNQYSQGNIPKYIKETENTLRGYAETLNKIIIFINSLDNAPRIDVFNVPRNKISTKNSETNIDVDNLIKYNNIYNNKRIPNRTAGCNKYYNNPILNIIYTNFYNKYIIKNNCNFSIYNMNNSYKKILLEYDTDNEYINKIINDIYVYKVEDMAYYITIKKYINILRSNKMNFLFNLFKRYIKYGYLILKFRIILNNNENYHNNIITYFLTKLITNSVKYDIIYDYIKSTYNLSNWENKYNLNRLSQKIIIDYAYTLFLSNYYNKDILDKNIIYLYYNDTTNDIININMLYFINYLELNKNDKKYYIYLLNFKNKIFEEHIKYLLHDDNNIKENINFMIDKHIIINNNFITNNQINQN